MPSDLRASKTVEALQLLASVGVELEADLYRKVRWIKIEDGQILFNNEYEIDAGEAVEMALLLLAYARRLKKL